MFSLSLFVQFFFPGVERSVSDCIGREALHRGAPTAPGGHQPCRSVALHDVHPAGLAEYLSLPSLGKAASYGAWTKGALYIP
ncbi:uncharacterized protein EI90DRAFT_3127531 [Cantharellus anzutake]|uniref:uncharacterized protein n=1 Tax=Cantharellus anzutake TaxID=1750568 RepID=UPI001908796D|nr:uncharacterized protein EI90DRAFT_3127531 [Cantharellus anzutake]KAF8327036.1 hypothetical protein EI90DRAFT_3127531 [Cantharellus anzutake]